MRPVLMVLILVTVGLCAAVVYNKHAPDAGIESVRHDVVSQPAAPSRSLEERAARAQGTTLPPEVPRSNPAAFPDEPVERMDATGATSQHHCDGRSYCSQMHSCAEARWFLEHCPGMNMDGDNDGTPCETQWCKGPFSP